MQTYDVRGIEVHLDDGPVHRPQQLLHEDLNVPLGGTLPNTKTAACLWRSKTGSLSTLLQLYSILQQQLF